MTVQTYVLMNILYWHSRYLNPCHAATCASRNYEPRFDQQKATHITRHRDRYICWEKLKTDNEQTHVHVIFFSRTYMRQSSVGMMAASEVEPPSAEMTTTSVVPVTETFLIVTYSLIYYNLEENGFMKILRAS